MKINNALASVLADHGMNADMFDAVIDGSQFESLITDAQTTHCKVRRVVHNDRFKFVVDLEDLGGPYRMTIKRRGKNLDVTVGGNGVISTRKFRQMKRDRVEWEWDGILANIRETTRIQVLGDK